jgi:hypothetical protein
VETEVRATLVADASTFTSGMRRAEQALDQFDNKANRTNNTLVKLSGIIGTITAATALFGRRAFQAATDLDEMVITMNAVGRATGIGSERISEAASAIEAMGIEMSESRRIAVQFAQNQLDLAQAANLARVAQDLAVVSQSNSTQTLQRLVRGVMTGNSIILRGAGITTQAGEAYKRYAAELGVAAGSLNAAQRQQAIINAILEEGTRVSGAYTASMDNAGKVLRSFPRILTNIRIAFGNTLLTGMNPLILGTYRLTQAFSEAINITPKYNEETGEVTTKVGGLVNAMRALETVFTAIMKPITEVLDRLREWVNTLQVSEEQALRFANRLAPLVPVITSVAAAMSALAATTLLRFIPGFRMFAGVINPGVIAFLGFIATSTQVQDALGNLWNTIQPLIPTFQTIAEQVIGFAMALGTSLVPLVVELANVILQSLTPLLNWLATSAAGEQIVRLLAIAFLIAKTNLANFVYVLAVSGYKALINFGRRLVVTGGNVRAFASLALQAKTAQEMAALGTTVFSRALTGLKVAIRGVLAATGIGLLIVGLSLLVEAFIRGWQTSQKFRDRVVDAINVVIGGFEKLANAAIKTLNVFLPKSAEIGAVSFSRMAYSIIDDANAIGDAMGIFDELVERLQRPGSEEDLARQAEIAAMMAGTMDSAAGAASRLADQLRRVNQVAYDFGRWALEVIDTRDPIAKATDEIAYQFDKFNAAMEDASTTADELVQNFSTLASTIRSQLGQALSFARQELARAQQAFDDFSNTIQSSILGVINFGDALTAGSGLIAAFENLRDTVGTTLGGMLEFRALASAPTSRQYVGFVKSLGDALGVLSERVEDSFLGRLRERRDQITQFGETLQELGRMGLSESALRQIMASGYEAGLSIARELVSGGEEAIRDVNRMTEEVASVIELISSDVAQDFYEGGGKTGDEFVRGLMEQTSKAEEFAAKIRQLIEMGLEPAAIRQVLAAGYDAGGRIADELIAGGATVVNKVNAMYSAVEKVAKDTGEFGARRFFQAGVDAAQAMIDGIVRTIQANDALLSNMLQQLAAKLRAMEAQTAAAAAAAAQKSITVSGGVTRAQFDPLTYDWAAEGAGSRPREDVPIARPMTAAQNILGARDSLIAASVDARARQAAASGTSVVINQTNNISSQVDAASFLNQQDWFIRQALR